MSKYEIKHICGHTSTKNISDDNSAEWYASRPCWECVKAEATAKAKSEAEAKGLPALAGSPKQIAWAETIRAEIIEDLERSIAGAVLSDAGKEAIAMLRGVAGAKWWIDNRARPAMDLVKMLYEAKQ